MQWTCVLASMSAVVLAMGLIDDQVERQQPIAVIGARSGAPFARGGQFEGRAKELIAVVEGPLPGVQAMSAGEEADTVVTVKLDEPMGEEATISFWMRPGVWYGNGEGQESVQRQLIEVPGIARCVFRQGKAACNLSWSWDKPEVKGVDAMSTNVPELPGPEWYYVLYTWDAKRGLFDAFVNGTAQRLPGTEVGLWSMEPRAEVRLHLEAFQLAEVSVKPAYLPPEQAQMEVPFQYRGRHADLFGATGDRLPVEVESRLGEVLYESSLSSMGSVGDWVMEGPGILRFEDGWMQMSSESTDGPEGHIVHWCPRDFPQRFVAEWEIQPMSKYGLCIVFFSAKGENGEDIFDPRLPKRSGVFNQYTNGAIVSYHVSYYANTPFNPGRITSNMRKNNNFYLVANGPPGIPPGSMETHQIRLIRDGVHMQLLVDGRVIVDFADDGKRYGPVHGDGKIGLRQMKWMVARYRNFRVWELETSR